MWGWSGRVLYPFMLFAKSRKDVPDWLFRHELQHIYQVQKYGWFVFHLKYLLLLMKHGYGKHPFELEAVAKQDEPLTAKERKLKGA